MSKICKRIKHFNPEYHDVIAWNYIVILLLARTNRRIAADFWLSHDDRIQWKYSPRYWPFVRGIHRSPVNSPHKGQWRGALVFSLICAWINGWVNNRKAGDLRRHGAHYDVTVMVNARVMSLQRAVEEGICDNLFILGQTGSGNGLQSSVWHQSITWTNTNSLSFGPFGTILSEVSVERNTHFFIHENAFEDVICEKLVILSSGRWVIVMSMAMGFISVTWTVRQIGCDGNPLG